MPSDTLQLSELFYSIQGESSYAGYPCVFIRLAGCNLRCTYCDAKYTYEESAKEASLAEIIDFVKQYPNALVEITGGEPLIQKSVYELIKSLLALRRKVLLETNGTIDLSALDSKVIKIMDLKCPNSGMHDKILLDNFTKLSAHDEVKCVVGSRSDYDWAVNILRNYDLLDGPDQKNIAGKAQVIFSPETPRLQAAKLAEWLLTDKLNARLQIQLHKILWPDINRGA